jgi:transcriptional regulator with XRE-family HTH domain
MGNADHLLYWRKQKGLSLAKLAARIEANGYYYVSPNTLNRWEKHETPMPEWAIAELTKALKITEDEMLYGSTRSEIQPANISTSFTGLDLEIADHVVKMGFTSWVASQSTEARRAVESILPWLETTQRRAPLTSQLKQGKHILSRGYELLGVLALDQLENDTAISYFRRALAISEELRDTNLIAAHTTELGEAHRRRDDKETALALMENALSYQGLDRATQGYVREMIAYTYAENNQEQQFRRHIEEAANLLGHSEEGEGAGQRDFIPFEVLEIYGKAMRDFGHPAEALQLFDQAETALKTRPYAPRWQAVLSISKAQAMCDAGDLEAGISLATQGLLLAHNCQSARQMNRVRKLVRKLDRSQYKDTPLLFPLHQLVSDIYLGNRDPLQWQPQHGI